MTEVPPTRLDAIVLAGGLGTRLREVLPNQQKVTAPVAGQPFLLRLLRWLDDAGIAQIVLAAGHRAGDVQAIAAGHTDSGLPPRVSIEPVALGTGGAARLALGLTESDPVLVLNGDSFARIDLAAFRKFHRARRAQVSLALVQIAETGRFGAVEVGTDNSVVSFREKPGSGAHPSAINAGIYLFERAALAALPEQQPLSLERDVFPGLIGMGLYAMHFNIGFIDIGTPESLRTAADFFEGRGSTP